MQTEKIYYEKCFPLGGYSNEKIGISITLSPDEQPVDAFVQAKKEVQKAHLFFKDLPNYEQAKKIISNPDEFTGYQVKDAHTTIELFEANFPEYLAKAGNVSRQLNEAAKDELKF